MVKIGEAKKT